MFEDAFVSFPKHTRAQPEREFAADSLEIQQRIPGLLNFWLLPQGKSEHAEGDDVAALVD
jgi:hypothetical protein